MTFQRQGGYDRMNSLWVVVVGVVVITLAYRLYAKRIDRVVI